MKFKKGLTLLALLTITTTQTIYADPNPQLSQSQTGLGDRKIEKYENIKSPMTVEERINQYETTIRGILRESQAAADAGIILDGEYDIFAESDLGGTITQSTFDDGASFNLGTVQETVYFTLLKNGFSPAAAAGIMGNIQQESGFNPGLEEKTARVEKGYGLIQWTFGRRGELENFAKGKEKPSSDVKTQLEFLILELNSKPYEQKMIGRELGVKKEQALNKFKSLTDPVQAADAFCWGFERPNKLHAHIAKRRGWARKYYEQFSRLNLSDYNRTKTGDTLEANERQYAAYAERYDVPNGYGTGTRLNLLKRIESMKGARVSKYRRNVSGFYDAPSFVDRTTAFVTGYRTPGNVMASGSDVYTGEGPFKLFAHSWHISRFNTRNPIGVNPIDSDLNSVRFIEITKEELKPGDICYVNTKEKSHVEFYMGNGRTFGAVNEALGVNWSKYSGDEAVDYFERFYRTLKLRPVESGTDRSALDKAKAEEKNKLATERDASSDRSNSTGQIGRPIDDLGKPLYDWQDPNN